jgi:Tfp pilus assembly pilus retraction ATPase PilT
MEREKCVGESVLPMTSFDPLDRELLERALEAAHAALKSNCPRDALESDEALEHALRRELIDIARTAGISDAETLCDLALRAFETGRLSP